MTEFTGSNLLALNLHLNASISGSVCLNLEIKVLLGTLELEVEGSHISMPYKMLMLSLNTCSLFVFLSCAASMIYTLANSNRKTCN